MRADRAVRSVVGMPGRLEGAEKLRRAAALVERRDERGADVALAARPEERSRRDDDPELVEQAQGERLRVAEPVRPTHAQPQEEARIAAAALEADTLEGGEDDVALGRVPLAGLDDVVLLAPRDRRRALHERRRGGADVRAVALQRGDELGVAGREAGAVAGHRR